MRTVRTALGLVTLAVALGCAGLVPMPVEEVPVDPQVQELLDAEQGDDPPLEGDALKARQTALSAFLTATTDFADWKAATLDCLEGECAETTEAAYGQAKTDYAAKEPAVAMVTAGDWRVIAIVDHMYAPTEDWMAFSDLVEGGMDGVATVRADLGVYAVSVQKDGTEGAKLDLLPFASDHEPKVGYVLAKKGADPLWQDHAPPDVLVPAACAYFGIDPCKVPEEGEDGEDGGEGDDGKAKKGGTGARRDWKAKGGKGGKR